MRYQIIKGTSYDARTPGEVIRVLEHARQNRSRIHLSYGETTGSAAGHDWLEEDDAYGYIGRSMGPIKVPILLANRRSSGGGAILDHCIVRIRRSAGGKVLYQHPTYQLGKLLIRQVTGAGEPRAEVLRDGVPYAAFDNMTQVRRWLQKLGVRAIDAN